jgi:DNA-binding NarL/FixJ family response regulator
MRRPDPAAGLQPIDARQLNIHEHEVGVQAAGGHHGLFPRLRLAHDLKALRRVDHLSRRGAKGFLVVADQHVHGHTSARSLVGGSRPAKGACTISFGGASPILGAMPIRVVLADDSFIVREGVRELLQSVDELDVVAAVGDLDSLRAAIDREKPDVVLTDIRMPPTNTDEGIRLAESLRTSAPSVGVVVLSQYADAEYALALLEKGAAGRGYLLKERVSDLDQLVNAIKEVARGGSVIDAKVVENLITARSRNKKSAISDLTPRESEVLGAVAEGKNNAAIAGALHLTEGAVEKHISSIFSKLGLSEEEAIHRRVKAALIFLAEAREPEKR